MTTSDPVEVDGRNERQWIDSAVAYCYWRAGEAWRRLSDPKQRWDAERLNYLQAARILRDAGFYAIQRKEAGQPPLPSLDSSPLPSPEERALAERTRPQLIAILTAICPERDPRIMKGFPRAKLARLITQAHAALPKTEARTA